MKMIETVARALAEGAYDNMKANGLIPYGVGMEEFVDHQWRNWEPRAELAIRAMHVPTDEMVEAAEELIPWSRGTETRSGMPTPEAIWRAMWDAALSSGHRAGEGAGS